MIAIGRDGRRLLDGGNAPGTPDQPVGRHVLN
jgi:hypothetical protein